MEKLNPNHLNKLMFLQSRDLAADTAAQYLSEVEAGICHLHSLRFIHNDLNSMNIMITESDTSIIIDFDSCLEIGAPIKNLKRMYGWYDREVQLSQKSNDLAALQELQVWLLGTSPDRFQYRDN